jgi:transketolase
MSSDLNSLEALGVKVRRTILQLAFQAGSKSAHIGGALSLVESLVAVYFADFKTLPAFAQRRAILSKGHASIALYATLFHKGLISLQQINDYPNNLWELPGHPVINRDLGIEFSTGSLGMGLSLGVGLALSEKLKAKNTAIFVMLGDGESNEGSVWEAAQSAVTHKLENLYVIVDQNKFQQTGHTKDISGETRLAEKFKSFGFETQSCNGNNLIEVVDALTHLGGLSGAPKCLIAETKKGAGIDFMESDNVWHHAPLTEANYQKAIEILSAYEKNIIAI